MFNKKEWAKTKKGKISKHKSDKQWRKNNPNYRKNNNKKINENQRRHIEKKREYIQEYKLSKGCAICGYNKCVRALVFHHNGDKGFSMNNACSRSLKKIKEEMEKCTVLCMNCHMELHEKIVKGSESNVEKN